MIGSSQGGQPTQPRTGIYNPTQPYNGYSSQQAFEQAGSPKGGGGPRPPRPGQYQGAPQSMGFPDNGQSTIRQPKYISDDATEGAVNNVLARGYQNADHHYQMKQLDRAGFSRGKGAQYIAGQQGVQEMGKAASEAAGVRATDQMQNAQMRSDYEKARESEAQSAQMTAQAFNQANWSQAFAQQQAAMQLMMSLMSPSAIPSPPRPPSR